MSLSAIWDRFWWSLLITIGTGLIWLKFIDPLVPCVSVGLIICIGIGLTYFSIGIRKLAMQHKTEVEIEQKAHHGLLAELQKERDQ